MGQPRPAQARDKGEARPALSRDKGEITPAQARDELETSPALSRDDGQITPGRDEGGAGHLDLLILGLNYAPETVGTGRYTAGMAEWLAARGHRVRVVAAQPYYPAWRVFDGYRRALPRRTREAGVEVWRCPIHVPRRPGGLKRLLHHASFAAVAALVLPLALSRGRPDVVLVIAPSLVSAPVGWLAARVTGARAWLHVQDLEVGAALATGLLRAGRIGRIARAYEGWALRRFDRVSSISAPMLAQLAAAGVTPARLAEMRNWSDLGPPPPGAEVQALAARLGVAGQDVVLYSGTLGTKQGLELLPDLARRLAGRPRFRLLICGEGPGLAPLRAAVGGLPVTLCPLQPAADLPALLSLARVHLMPQTAGAADLVLPSKLANMLASGRPVVATAVPGTALAAEVAGCGLVVPPGDGAALADAVAALLDDPARAAAFGAAARRRAATRWSQDAILTAFEAELLGTLPATARAP
ncbi:WcaI family glycosyltransferase [Halodurantibacterium flavum]|uniref:WcaI family glycosyltransferase n=2 Tax=Halodurantibacterium flavum TaxID=1382802 RepID=A0ABW4S5L0_9RHOB